MKIILNKCFGGFGVSGAGLDLYAQKKGIILCPYRTIKGVEGVLTRGNLMNYDYCFTKDLGERLCLAQADWDALFLLDASHRQDETLIEVVEELGEKASGFYAKLKIVDIPDDLDYVIEDYDGFETLHQRVQIW